MSEHHDTSPRAPARRPYGLRATRAWLLDLLPEIVLGFGTHRTERDLMDYLGLSFMRDRSNLAWSASQRRYVSVVQPYTVGSDGVLVRNLPDLVAWHDTLVGDPAPGDASNRGRSMVQAKHAADALRVAAVAARCVRIG